MGIGLVMEMWSQTRHAAACWEKSPQASAMEWIPLESQQTTQHSDLFLLAGILHCSKYDINKVIQRATWNDSSRARSFHCNRRNDTCISLNRWFFPWW